MNNKWFLKLMGSLLAVFLITGCNTDDQNPPPENNGLETPGEGFNNDVDNDLDNNLDNNVTPEEEAVPNNNGMNRGDQDVVEDENRDRDLDLNNDNNNRNDNNNKVNPSGTGGAEGAGAGGTGGGK
ncbi:hypothetical protein [Bacillus sp. JJ1562]|uniref:hypothetical protein n=1 Tax=Bacillus sp. JJ1562 TaxID=3122960 RepID=UPI003002C250